MSDESGNSVIYHQATDNAALMVLDASDSDPVLEFARSVSVGLSDTSRWLHCRYLYDKRGSELFEQICELPEYYPTRIEAAILEKHAAEIREVTGPVTIIELGSGTSVKTDYLLTAYTRDGVPVRYVPVDVSESALQLAAQTIGERHPLVQFSGMAGTYESAFPLFREHSPSMVVFLGSTIGNFNSAESSRFLSQLAENMQSGDHLLLGIDLVKDVPVLEAAYNDHAGVTAEFTKNIFARMNRELGSSVDLENIKHIAVYNPKRRQIEVFVEFLTYQDVEIEPLGERFPIAAGERVMVVISRKFVLPQMRDHVAQFGFSLDLAYTDDDRMFALLLMQRDH
ncbi:MAG: L-histidine N(alpha)-methyltransferase [Gemmatimonadales bacterium]